MWIDLALGVVWGLYQPYMERARLYDCTTAFQNFGIELINWSLMTDAYWFKGFTDIYSVVWFTLTLLNHVLLFWRVMDTCSAQYDYSVSSKWLTKMWA